MIQNHPKSSNADNAQFWIGETYYKEKWYEKAILEYQKVIEKYPSGNKAPAALLKTMFARRSRGSTIACGSAARPGCGRIATTKW